MTKNVAEVENEQKLLYCHTRVLNLREAVLHQTINSHMIHTNSSAYSLRD